MAQNGERESSLPKMDDLDFNPEISVKKEIEMNKSEPKIKDDFSKPKYSPRPQFDDSSSDEDNILDQLGKKMKDTSFIAGNKDYADKYQTQEKKKDEIMDLIGGIGDEMSAIKLDENDPYGRNKSAILPTNISKIDSFAKQKKSPEVGDRILKGIDGYDLKDDYQEKLLKAHEILDEEDSPRIIKNYAKDEFVDLIYSDKKITEEIASSKK